MKALYFVLILILFAYENSYSEDKSYFSISLASGFPTMNFGSKDIYNDSAGLVTNGVILSGSEPNVPMPALLPIDLVPNSSLISTKTYTSVPKWHYLGAKPEFLDVATYSSIGYYQINSYQQKFGTVNVGLGLGHR